MLLSVVSCLDFRPLQTNPDEGTKGIPVSFRIITDDHVPVTKVNVGNIGGSAGDQITSIQMLCFDASGLYVGSSNASPVTSTYTVTDASPDDEGTFKGEVPPTTSRIHFVANHTCNIPGEKVGFSEDQLMHDPTYVTTDKSKVAYWGYLRKDSDAEMKAALKDANTVIYLLRDRFMIEAGTLGDANIRSARWTIYNGQDRGMIAPFNANASGNKFEGYYDSSKNPYEPSSTMTLNPNARLNETTSSELQAFTSGAHLFAFEDLNSLNDPSKTVRIVVEATFTDNSVKYFPVLMQKPDGSQLEMLRSHKYVLNINFLPEVMGYGTFVEAAAATSFANGQLVSIDKVVTGVSDGEYNMQVTLVGTNGEYSTSVVYQDSSEVQSDGYVYIPFIYGKKSGDNTVLPNEDITITARWYSAEHTVGELPTGAVVYNGRSSIDGFVKLQLNEISDNIKSGRIVLEDKTHNLTRDIFVYSIKKFQLAGLSLAAGGTQNYRLTLTLPSTNEYPDGLYPLTIMMASKSLQPLGIVTTPQDANPIFGVSVESTVPESVTGGVSGITATTNTSAWNYQDPNRYWNFWYTYTLISKPTSNTILIDFKNISLTYSTPPGVGLYLKMKYFGDAIAVTP